MESKFSIGDEVRVISDTQSYYVVRKVVNINGAYFYNLEGVNVDFRLEGVAESLIY